MERHRLPETFEPLTDRELAEITRRRAAARLRALELDLMPGADATEDGRAEVDRDNPPLSDEQLARMRPAYKVLPLLVADRLRKASFRKA